MKVKEIAGVLGKSHSFGTFKRNHPKVEGFIDKINKKGICEDAEVIVMIKYPDGDEAKVGIRVKKPDIEFLDKILRH